MITIWLHVLIYGLTLLYMTTFTVFTSKKSYKNLVQLIQPIVGVTNAIDKLLTTDKFKLT